MESSDLKKKIRDFSASQSSEGVCLINTKTGEISCKMGFTDQAESLLEATIKSEKLNELNSQFNTIFYKLGYPELISYKFEECTEFIKFMDKKHVAYFIISNQLMNQAKIKINVEKYLH